MLKSFRDYLITFLIALVIFAVAAYFLVGYIINNVFNTSHIGPDGPDSTIDTSSDPGIITPTEDDKSASFNFLFIGTDYQPDILSDYNKQTIDRLFPGNSYTSEINFDISELGLDTPKPRDITAESMILIRVDKENKQFVYIPLPSNMLVSVSGANVALGCVYQDYGLEFLMDKIYALTGLSIDYYAVATISACEQIIDMFDGITYTVPCDMKYSDPEQNLEISLKAGSQKLSGAQALQLLRFNSYTDSINTRAKTIMSFTKAMISKMTNVLYLPTAKEMFETASKTVMTNFSAEDFEKNINLIFSYSNFEILELSYPGSNSYVDGVRYFTPSVEKAIASFKKYRQK